MIMKMKMEMKCQSLTLDKYTGRWHNDIKEATVKCKAEYGITRIFFGGEALK